MQALLVMIHPSLKTGTFIGAGFTMHTQKFCLSFRFRVAINFHI